MKVLHIISGFIIVLIFMGCYSPKVHVYSELEKSHRFGGASYQVGATGEVQYCNAGLPQLVESRRQDALKEISQICNGNYYVTAETDSTMLGSYAGNIALTPSCNRGRTIIFKCAKNKK